jgi:hypothetical protein
MGLRMALLAVAAVIAAGCEHNQNFARATTTYYRTESDTIIHSQTSSVGRYVTPPDAPVLVDAYAGTYVDLEDPSRPFALLGTSAQTTFDDVTVSATVEVYVPTHHQQDPELYTNVSIEVPW